MGRGGAAERRRDAGDDGYFDAVAAEVGRFLAGPSEHHGIAALQADDAAATAGVFQQQGVDLGLLHGMAAGALADGDALGVAAGEFQHAGADQMVVQDHVGALDGADRGQGQKLGVAGAGADEVDHSGTGVGLAGGGAGEQAVHFEAGFFRAAMHGEIASAAVEHFVPVAQALAGGGQGVLDLAAEFPGQMRQAAEGGGDSGFPAAGGSGGPAPGRGRRSKPRR